MSSWFSAKVFLYRAALFSTVFGGALLAYKFSASFVSAGLAAVAIFAIWVIVANMVEILGGRRFRRFLEAYGVPAGVDARDSQMRDYISFDSRIFTAIVHPTTEGIYIYSLGIAVCIIPWSNLSTIKLDQVAGRVRAHLTFPHPVEGVSKLGLPWSREFDALVPNSVLLVRSNG